METCRVFCCCSVIISLSLCKISDAFENEMAKKVKLQNVLSQLRKCVDHPYLFDGEAVLFFLSITFCCHFMANLIEGSSKDLSVFTIYFSPFSLVNFLC